MTQLREFTETDWYGFSGCEPWADGHEPLVAYGAPVENWVTDAPDGVTVVADATGVGVWSFAGLGNYLFLCLSDRITAVAIAELILSKPINHQVLLALGFKGE